MVQLHPKGGARIVQVRDVMRKQFRMYAKGETPLWVSVAVRPGLEEAEAALGEIRRELRKNKNAEGEA